MWTVRSRRPATVAGRARDGGRAGRHTNESLDYPSTGIPCVNVR